MKERGIRDLNGRFISQKELLYLRTNKGRKRIGLCNCCKTNTIPKRRFYCDNCRDWIEAATSRKRTKIYNLQTKVNRYMEFFRGSNPGNVMQMLKSFRSYKSSADHYRKKCGLILKAYNELKAKSGEEHYNFKLQSNSVSLNAHA